MSERNEESSARLAALAKEVLTMPTAGTIEAEKALALMGEAVSIIGALLAESSKLLAESSEHVAIGVELAQRCHQLYDQNTALLIDRAMERPAATA